MAIEKEQHFFFTKKSSTKLKVDAKKQAEDHSRLFNLQFDIENKLRGLFFMAL